MPAAAYGEREPLVTCKADGADYVGYVDTARDKRGVLVDHAVINLASALVGHIARLDQLAVQSRCELLNRRVIQWGRYLSLLGHRILLLCAKTTVRLRQDQQLLGQPRFANARFVSAPLVYDALSINPWWRRVCALLSGMPL